MAAATCLPSCLPTEANANAAQAPRRESVILAAHRVRSLLEWFLSRRALLIFVSSLMLLCSELNFQPPSERSPGPDLGVRNGADMLDPLAGVALSRTYVLVHNRARGQQTLVMRRLAKAPVLHVGASGRRCTTQVDESSMDDPIEVLERTGRNLIAAKRRIRSGNYHLDDTLGKQLVEIYGALANIYQSREQHLEAFHMIRLADEASASVPQ